MENLGYYLAGFVAGFFVCFFVMLEVADRLLAKYRGK